MASPPDPLSSLSLLPPLPEPPCATLTTSKTDLSSLVAALTSVRPAAVAVELPLPPPGSGDERVLRIVEAPRKRPPEEVHAEAMARGALCRFADGEGEERCCPFYGMDRGPVMPTLRPGAPLLAVGEGPGKYELDAQEGFVGPSGRRMNYALALGGISRPEIAVSNSTLCAPPDKVSFSDFTASLLARHARQKKRWETKWLDKSELRRTPQKRAQLAVMRWEQAGRPAPAPPRPPVLPEVACYPRLVRDIQDAHATVVLALGAKALETTAAAFQVSAASIKRQHGAPILLPGTGPNATIGSKVLIASYHPAFAMRENVEYTPVIRDDIARAARIARRGGTIEWSWPAVIDLQEVRGDARGTACGSTVTLFPTVEYVEWTVERWLAAGLAVTADLETDDIDPHTCKVRCAGVGVTWPDGREEVMVVPFRRKEDGTLWWPTEEAKVRVALALRKLFDTAPVLIFQNGTFDTTILLRVGLMANRERSWVDVLILHKNTWDNDLPHDLGAITRRLYEVILWKEDVSHKAGSATTNKELNQYCSYDVVSTMRDVPPLWQWVQACGTQPQLETDTALLPVVRDMSELGLPVNEYQRGKLSNILNKETHRLRREWEDLVGKPVNPRSVPQLQELLYVDWGYDPVLTTDDTDFDPEEDDREDGATGNGALTRLLKEREVLPQHRRAINTLLTHRANDKVRSMVDRLPTYDFAGLDDCVAEWGRAPGTWSGQPFPDVGWCDPVKAWVYDEKQDKDVLVEVIPRRRGISLARTTYKLHGPSTGRLASGDPINLQNVPKRARGDLNLRTMFCTPPGHVFVKSDYKQLEARIYAVIAQDKVLLDAIHNNLDIHALNAASLLIEPGEQLMDAYRHVLTKPKAEREYVRTVAKRFCIAEGEPVLVLRDGETREVPIEHVKDCDHVWDGVEWVEHDGIIDQGVREVVFYDGLWATEDHDVWIRDGQKVPFGVAAAQRLQLARTGEAGRPLRLLGYRERSLARDTRSEFATDGNGTLHLRNGEDGLLRQSEVGQEHLLSFLCDEAEALGRRCDDTRMGTRPVPVSQESLYESWGPPLSELRRAWNRVPVCVGRSGGALDDRQLWVTCTKPIYPARSEKQRRKLRTWEPALDERPCERSQPALLKAAGSMGICRDRMALSAGYGGPVSYSQHDARRDPRAGTRDGTSQEKRLASCRRTVRTYDLLNAGPRRRFTVAGRLASNCFGLIYGAGWKKLYAVMVAERNKATGELLFPNVTERDCQIWEANWHALHPETRQFHAMAHAFFEANGFVQVPMIDFRRRFFPEEVRDDENALPNLFVQGAAASMANRALRFLAKAIPYRGWSPYSGPCSQTHDELVAIVPHARAAEGRRLLVECMEYDWNGMHFGVDDEVAWSWG